MKEISFIFLLIGLFVLCYNIGGWIAYWWDERPMSKKQRAACIKWETENKYLSE